MIMLTSATGKVLADAALYRATTGQRTGLETPAAWRSPSPVPRAAWHVLFEPVGAPRKRTAARLKAEGKGMARKNLCRVASAETVEQARQALWTSVEKWLTTGHGARVTIQPPTRWGALRCVLYRAGHRAGYLHSRATGAPRSSLATAKTLVLPWHHGGR
jgi:hypothetical protein